MGPPKALDWPNPMSSISTMRMLGALAGALTSKRGGGVALRTSNTVLCGYVGSGIGNTVRSVGRTTRSGAAPWAATGAAVSGPSTSMRAMRASVIDVLIPCSPPVALFSLAPQAPSRLDIGPIRPPASCHGEDQLNRVGD